MRSDCADALHVSEKWLAALPASDSFKLVQHTWLGRTMRIGHRLVIIRLSMASPVAVWAQTAPTTTVNISIQNNLTSSPIGQQKSPSCSSTVTCTTPSPSSIPAHQSGSEQISDSGTSSGSYLQNFGGNVGTVLYACNFQTFLDSNLSGGCHALSGSASATNGPGGNHPACSYMVNAQPSGPSCQGGMITFNITQ